MAIPAVPAGRWRGNFRVRAPGDSAISALAYGMETVLASLLTLPRLT